MNMRHEDLDASRASSSGANDVIEESTRSCGDRRAAVVIQGEDDKLVEPERGRRLAATLPDARLEMVPGRPHGPVRPSGRRRERGDATELPAQR